MKGKFTWLAGALAISALTIGSVGCVADATDEEEEVTEPATGQGAAAVTLTPLLPDPSSGKATDPPLPSGIVPGDSCGPGLDPEPSPWQPQTDQQQRHNN
jgi:hypothetical protein